MLPAGRKVTYMGNRARGIYMGAERGRAQYKVLPCGELVMGITRLLRKVRRNCVYDGSFVMITKLCGDKSFV